MPLSFLISHILELPLINYTNLVLTVLGSEPLEQVSIKDYENLGKNFAELRRYIEQQKQIIVYYEEATRPSESETDDGDKE